MIIKPRRRLPMVEKVIRLSVIVPFFSVEGYATEKLIGLEQNAAPGVEFVLPRSLPLRQQMPRLRRRRFRRLGRPQTMLTRKLLGGAINETVMRSDGWASRSWN